MNFKDYDALFDAILNAESPAEPYNDPEYFNYTKLNRSRFNRWFKTAEILEETKTKIAAISSPQKWIVIAEPWCGDAAHIIPFIKMMADVNPKIELDIELRDAAPNRIENYLTNGGKSIPILIIQDENGNDKAVWGPRPENCKIMFAERKAQGMELPELKVELQNWYNENKGIDIQKEISSLL